MTIGEKIQHHIDKHRLIDGVIDNSTNRIIDHFHLQWRPDAAAIITSAIQCDLSDNQHYSRKNMMQVFKLGDTIFGYCNGFFGRDSYDNKICVFVTLKYAVFECEPNGYAEVLNLTERLQISIADGSVDKWRRPEN